MTKKAASLSSSLVAVKGKATSAPDAKGRQSEETSTNDRPLNFKVDAEFRRRFRQHAANHDLKLSELLREAVAAWEEKHGIK